MEHKRGQNCQGKLILETCCTGLTLGKNRSRSGISVRKWPTDPSAENAGKKIHLSSKNAANRDESGY